MSVVLGGCHQTPSPNCCRHPRSQERLRECDRRPQSPHRLRWPPSSRRPWVSRHHALAFAVLAAKNPSHLVSPQKQKRSPFVGLQEPPAPGQGPMSLPVDALPRNSVPGLASSGRSPCHFGWLKNNSRRNGHVPGEPCSFRETRSFLCYDHVHRDVIRLRVDRQERLLSIAHPQLEWRVFHRCERQVEETTSIPQAITSPVEANDGRDNYIGPRFPRCLQAP